MSVKMTLAFAMISHELNTRTRRFWLVMRLVANASASVRLGKCQIARDSIVPSGTATTITVIEMIRIETTLLAFSDAVLIQCVD